MTMQPVLVRRLSWWWSRFGGWTLWGVLVAVLSVLAVVRPMRPITRIYHAASVDWWSSIPVYTEGIHGFLYLPSAAAAYGPFALLPVWVADHLWRLGTVALMTWGVVRALALFDRATAGRTAQWVLVLGIPTLSVNILRGQWDLTMLAILLHAAVDAAGGRWRRGGLMLGTAIGLKPLALVAALLFAAARPRLIPWIATGLAAILILPFLHPDPGYVAGQYAAMVAKLTAAARPDSGRWFEIAMLLKTAGIVLGPSTLLAVRAGAAVAVLVLTLAAARRVDEPAASLLILACALLYLALFNPRTEEGSYAGPAVLAAVFLMRERALDRRAAGWCVAAAVVASGTHFYGDWIYRPTETWIKQVTGLGLLVGIVWAVARRRRFVLAAKLETPAPAMVPSAPRPERVPVEA